MTDEVPLERSAAKLRPLLDQPYPVSASGLQIIAAGTEKDAALAETTTTTTTNSSTKTSRKMRRAPRMRMCHLCGTPQLVRSYKMHYSKCAEAWKRDEEANKPEADRRPLPAGPQLRDGSQPSESTKPEDLEEFNRLALKIWKSQALETCPNCQRSFHSKALKAHMKGCHAEPFLGPSFISTSKQSEASRTRRYPTVKQSIERHTKAPAVSKPGPIKLVQERVDAFRGVPPNRRSSEDSPTNSCTVSRLASCSTLRSSPSPERRKSLLQRSSSCTPKTLTPSPSSPEGTPYHRQSSSAASSVPPCQKHFRGRQNIAVSYDHLGWRRERRTNHAQNHNDGDSPPRRQRRSRPDVEARLEALEAGHVAMSDTLRRIETILSSMSRSSLRQSETDGRFADKTAAQIRQPPPPQYSPTLSGRASLVRVSFPPPAYPSILHLQEHEILFKGRINLAWPEDVTSSGSEMC